MKLLKKVKTLFFGAPRNPLDRKTRKTIALSALLAWVGIGADGLSSSSYGPEQAYVALGNHPQLAIYLAIAIALTVFVISFAYNQVIELFPNGGGGYKVATSLLGKYAGLITGSALTVDYVLTITISVVTCVETTFSLLPTHFQPYKLLVDTALIILLIFLNLRGMKESIKVLMPIFLGFIVTHVVLLAYGIFSHGNQLPALAHNAVTDVHQLAHQAGLLFVIALFIHAYSLGGATYTGLEAVSNNVNVLSEPRVRTGKMTMFYMAVSLGLMAGGIILVYLLWHVHMVSGQTLNAVAFREILGHWRFAHPVLILTLLFEAGLLLMSANTGFLGGPAVLGNMAIDDWVPRRFRNLSSQLVTKNGIVLFGIAALLILYATEGSVTYLVILYSINVFLAFTISLLGLCFYWIRQRHQIDYWLRRFLLSLLGTIICGGILLLVIFSQFDHGGLTAILITGLVVIGCLLIKRHYSRLNKKLDKLNETLLPETAPTLDVPTLNPHQPTAVIFVGKNQGMTMHTLLWIQRLFPNYFKNFIFVRVGLIDMQSYGVEKALASMQNEVESRLDYFIHFIQDKQLSARKISSYAIDPAEKLSCITDELITEFENPIFFASKLVFERDTWFVRWLHNETAFTLQRQLYSKGSMMMILPMKI